MLRKLFVLTLAILLFNAVLSIGANPSPRPWDDESSYLYGEIFSDPNHPIIKLLDISQLNIKLYIYPYSSFKNAVDDVEAIKNLSFLDNNASICLEKAETFKSKVDYFEYNSEMFITPQHSIEIYKAPFLQSICNQHYEEVSNKAHSDPKSLYYMRGDSYFSLINNYCGINVACSEYEKERDNRTYHYYICSVSRSPRDYLGHYKVSSIADITRLLLTPPWIGAFGLIGFLISSQQAFFLADVSNSLTLYKQFMDACADVVDDSTVRLEIAKQKLDNITNNVSYYGICDNDFDQRALICDKIATTNEQIEKNSNASLYVSSKYLKEKLYKSMKAFDTYNPRFDGFADYYIKSYSFEKDINNIKDDYNKYLNSMLILERNLYLEVDSLKSLATKAKDEVKEQKLNLINAGFLTEDISSSTLDISRTVDEANADYEQANELFGKAKFMWNTKSNKWLKLSIINLQKAEHLFNVTNEKYNSALHSARSTVSKLSNITKSKILNLEKEGYNVSSLKQDYTKAINQETLGDKFVALTNVLMEANDLTKESQNINMSGLIAQLEDLISRARKDGLDATTYSTLLNKYKSMSNKQNAMLFMQGLKKMIIGDAKRSYDTPLILLKKQIQEYEDKLPNLKENIEDKLALIEGSYVKGYYINYVDAIGHLKEIKEGYLSILNYIKEQIPKLKDSLNIDYYIDAPNTLHANKKEQAKLFVNIYNPFDIDLENVEIKFNIPEDFPLMNYKVEGGKIQSNEFIINIPLLKAFSTSTASITTKDVFAQEIAQKTKTYARNDEAVEEYAITYDIKLDNVLVYPASNYDVVEVNNKQYITPYFSKKGIYDAKGYKELWNALSLSYDANEENISSNKKKVIYTLKINPKQDFDYVEVSLSRFKLNGAELISSPNGSFEINGKILRIDNVKAGSYIFKWKKIMGRDEDNLNDDDDNFGIFNESFNISNPFNESNESDNEYDNYSNQTNCSSLLNLYYLHLVNEINILKEALTKANQSNINGTLIDMISNRETSLLGLKSKVDQESDCFQKRVLLYDYKKTWINTELKSKAKIMFKEINKEVYKLRNKGFYDPEVEVLFNNLKRKELAIRACENDLTPIIEFQLLYNNIKDLINKKFSKFEENEEKNEEELKQNISSLEQNISNMKDELGNGQLYSIKLLEKRLTEAKKFLNTGQYGAALSKFNQAKELFNNINKKINDSIDDRIALIDNMLATSHLSDEEMKNAKAIRDKIINLKEKGEYAKAIKLADFLINKLKDKLKKKESFSLPLLISLILTGLGVALYFYKEEVAKMLNFNKPKKVKKLSRYKEDE